MAKEAFFNGENEKTKEEGKKGAGEQKVIIAGGEARMKRF